MILFSAIIISGKFSFCCSEEKSDAGGSKTASGSASGETPSGQRSATPPSVPGMANPFDFSAMSGLLNVYIFSFFLFGPSLCLKDGLLDR